MSDVEQILCCRSKVLIVGITNDFSAEVSCPIVATYGTFTSLAWLAPKGTLYRTLKGSACPWMQCLSSEHSCHFPSLPTSEQTSSIKYCMKRKFECNDESENSSPTIEHLLSTYTQVCEKDLLIGPDMCYMSVLLQVFDLVWWLTALDIISKLSTLKVIGLYSRLISCTVLLPHQYATRYNVISLLCIQAHQAYAWQQTGERRLIGAATLQVIN